MGSRIAADVQAPPGRPTLSRMGAPTQFTAMVARRAGQREHQHVVMRECSTRQSASLHSQQMWRIALRLVCGGSRRRAACYAWALLLARIHEVFPHQHPRGGEMQIVAFITVAFPIREVLACLENPAARERPAVADLGPRAQRRSDTDCRIRSRLRRVSPSGARRRARARGRLPVDVAGAHAAMRGALGELMRRAWRGRRGPDVSRGVGSMPAARPDNG